MNVLSTHRRFIFAGLFVLGFTLGAFMGCELNEQRWVRKFSSTGYKLVPVGY